MVSTGSIKSNESIFPILSTVLLLSLSAFADVSLNVSSSRPRIYLGESFNLTIEINGADRGVGAPDLSAVSNAEVQFLGQHSNSRSSISIINGRMTREVHEGRIFAYQIKPSSEGTFKAGPIRVMATGKSYTHPGVTVQVAGIEKQDTVIAAITASSTSVLVEEPFTVTLSVAVSELPDPYAENNEPLHPSHLPQLSADFLEIQQDMPGIKGPDLNQILNGLIDQSGRQPSFAINNYQTRDMGGFGNFFDSDPFRPRPIRFRLQPKRITINGKKYRQYTLSLTYTPTKEGEFTFGPLSFKGTVIAGVTADRQAATKDIYTIGPAVTVRVVPPPDEGRPEWFTGSVGKEMKATAMFDTTVCKVGDPLNLTLELTGSISVSNLRTPLLNLQPELTKDFRIYDDNVSTETLPNGKRFTYRVRPMREGTLEFPPIKVAYYDTVSRTYTSIATAPVPIQARATTQIATATDTSAGTPATDAGSLSHPLPASITLSPNGARPSSLLPHGRLPQLLLFIPPFLCLLTALVRPLVKGITSLRTHRRRSGALRRARTELRRADTPARAVRAARTYLTDRLDLAGCALTPDEVVSVLRQRHVPDDTARACGELLSRLDESMYRPDAKIPLQAVIASLIDLLSTIERVLDVPRPDDPDASDGTFRPNRSALLLFVLFAMPALLPALADDATRSFLWEQANTQAAAATKPEAYLRAANTYNRLVADGVCNGAVFINLGNTLVMAGDGVNAAAAFTRAERYLGVTPETRQGFFAATELQTGRRQADLPWFRAAFFWHYAFPCTMRAFAALGGWALFWLGILCRILLRRHRSAGPTFLSSFSEACIVTGALTAFIFAASTAVTLAHEKADAGTWGGRVFDSSQPSETEDAP